MTSHEFRDAAEFSAPSVKYTPEAPNSSYGLLRIENPVDIVRMEDISGFTLRGRQSVTRTVIMDRTGTAYRAQTSSADILQALSMGQPLEVRAARMADHELAQTAYTQSLLARQNEKVAPRLESEHFSFTRADDTKPHKAPGILVIKNFTAMQAIADISMEAYQPSSGDRDYKAAAILFEDGGNFTVPATLGEIIAAAKTQAAAQEQLTFPAYVNYEVIRQSALTLALSHFRRPDLGGGSKSAPDAVP